MYPKLVIDLKSIEHNITALIDMFKKRGVELSFVTKGCSADRRVVETIVRAGAETLADSRIENLKSYQDLNVQKILLRIPMLSEVEKVVKYSDISMNSSIETIRLLSEEALKQGKVHKIILMLDMGDLREGIFDEEEMFDTFEEIVKLKGIELLSVGVNLTCYGAIIPSRENLSRLVSLKEEFEKRFHISIPEVSGGNSSSIDLILKEDIKGVNRLRIGEGYLRGVESSYGTRIDGTKCNAFTLKAEIIELKEKPSVPIGEVGKDAFGNVPEFVDRGIRKKAIIGIGKQDVHPDDIHPIDGDIIILGASSDHTILDVTDSKINYKLGDIVEFNLDYGAILSLSTSKYVDREYI
ncbi:MAG: alanine/ornithine racemase family PLP-dependent enzyme [Tissierellia bacterium]|nr:alanine/ornithine racemase family PLP-dependent enzyme [Tissierellia bacterium]